MPAYVLDFSDAPWSSEAALDVKDEVAAGSDSGSIKERSVSKVESLRSLVRDNPRRSVALAVVLVGALLVGLLAGSLNHSATHRNTLAAASNHNNVSTSVPRIFSAVASSSAERPTPTVRFSLVSSHGSTHSTRKGSAASSAQIAVATSITSTSASQRSSCFPLGSATLPSTGAPSAARENWWCEADLMYGFLGWSLPLESSDCSDPSNGYAALNSQLAAMKARGASMVRIYAPQCRQVSVWENLVRACVHNNMGLVPMVWWGFGDQTLWKIGQANIYSLFTTSIYASIAPYVVHSASFGSEPIGDGVDGVITQFIADLAQFRSTMNGYGIPVGISEDWDRNTGDLMMNSTSGNGLGWVGELVQKNTDVVHAHVMPYYHPSETPEVTDSFPYIARYLQWLRTYVDQPLFITETMWASDPSGHTRGADDDQIGLSEFTQYWAWFSSNCALFKQYKVGWFFHTWDDSFEPGFGLLEDDGTTAKITGFHPKSC